MDHVSYIWVCVLFVGEIEIVNQNKITFKSSIESNTPITAELSLLALRSIQPMTGKPRPRYKVLQWLGESGACDSESYPPFILSARFPSCVLICFNMFLTGQQGWVSTFMVPRQQY